MGELKKLKENKRQLGSSKEEEAAKYLYDKGYAIIKMNFRTRSSEIDIIAKDKDTYVFVEVKYRKDESCGDPLEAVTPAKQRRIRMAALYFLEDMNLIPDYTDIRFDVIGITGNRIDHIENAF